MDSSKNKLTPIQNIGVFSKEVGSTMRDIMKTNTGSNYISQFMDNNDVFYGYKATKNGKYSDVNLNILEYNLQGSDKAKYEGVLGFAQRDRTTNISEVNGKLTINAYFKGDDAENIKHELFVHFAGQIDEIISTYRTKGIEAAQAILKNQDFDHLALKKMNTNHKGIKMYNYVFKELININPKYKPLFEQIKKTNTTKYAELK